MKLGIGMCVGSGAYIPPEPPFTPASMGSDLQLWLKADTGVTLVGAGVSNWADQSGKARDFVQATAANRPTVDATYINSTPALVFDGLNDILTGPSFAALSGLGSAEIYIVFKLVNDPPTTGSGGSWQLGSPNGTENYVPLTNGQIYAGEFSNARKSTAVNKGSNFFTTPRVYSVSSTNNLWKLYIDGVEEFSTATNTYTVGSDFAIGGDPESGGAVQLMGGIAEITIFSPKLSDANRGKMLEYLADAYGVAA